MTTAIRAALALVLACVVCGTRAETHALIMTIGAYTGSIPPLRGVKYDAESARAIAERMGVKDANMRFYKDEELTLEGMRKAFADLEQRVAPGDQVFVYYSGHGTRAKVRDPEERCAEALVTADGQAFVDTDMEAELRRLSARAQKIVALLDACHSGGVTTRGVGASDALFSPKFAPRGGADACEKPVNVLTRSISLKKSSPGSGANNYVYIAAARDNEVSLDMPSRGGVATQAWRECMTAAEDKDGSGALSAEEVRSCAQERINGMLKNVQGFVPHNVTITGNADAVMTFADRTTPSLPQAPAQAAPKPINVAGLPPAYYTLNDVLNGRDDKRVVSLRPSKTAFKIGLDEVSFTLNSTHAGHLYLLMVGTDGKTFDMLFPNKIDSDNAIEAGKQVVLPRPSWQIKAGGPPGKNYLLAIVADAPRDFSSIGMQPAGPFSMIGANTASSKDIQLVSHTSAAAGAPECSVPPNKRNLQVQQRCSDGYGAALTILEETN